MILQDDKICMIRYLDNEVGVGQNECALAFNKESEIVRTFVPKTSQQSHTCARYQSIIKAGGYKIN